MRLRSCALLLILGALLAGCGSPGEPLPPALNRPVPVVDLTALERGSKIIVRFTLPDKTTEGLPLRVASRVELRVGEPPVGGWNTALWEQTSERVPESSIRIEGAGAVANLDAAKFYRKTVVVGVRASGPGGRDAGWSRFDALDVVPALPRPESLEAKDAPNEVRLDWRAAAPQFRVYRRLAGETAWTESGRTDKPFYLDTSIEYGKTYQYSVQSIEKTGERFAESETSDTVTFMPVDRFPPAIPAGLVAIPATSTIELLWERSTESDFASYEVFRDGGKVAEGLTAPAFSDKDVKPIVRYRYQIRAVDAAGNKSSLSPVIEAAIP